MIAGRLPTLQSIPFASPSRIDSLFRCALREVFAVSNLPRLLPLSPAARVGLVAHRLLEEVGSSLVTSLNDLDSRWSNLVAVQEAEMMESWLERHLVPLRASFRFFEVRRIQVRERASDLLEERAENGDTWVPTRKLEVQLASRDSLLRGRADAVIATPDGPVIVDYKSGAIAERNRAGEVRAAYELQLKLYAAMYAEQYGEWPIRLEVTSLSGERRQVTFTVPEAISLAKRARESLLKINHTLSEAAPSSVQGLLASPGDVCSGCPYRPVCGPYRRAIDAGAVDVRDVWGTVTTTAVLGNGRRVLGVRAAGGQVITIRGLSSDERHPAMIGVTGGTAVAVFNLRGSPAAPEEQSETVIYRVDVEL